MGRLDVELTNYLSLANPEIAKKLSIARNNAALERAVKYVWRENEWAAHFVLAHVNAFYVRKDEKPARKKYRDTDWIICTICVDDGMVRADLDARQELLKLALKGEGIHLDELRLLPSKFDMKKRHPFQSSIDLLNGDFLASEADRRKEEAPEPISQQTLDSAVAAIDDPELARRLGKAMVTTAAWAHETAVGTKKGFELEHSAYRLSEEQDNLETLKRAFFLALGENTDQVLDKINRIYLEPRLFDPRRRNRREFQTYNCFIYSSDPRLPTIVEGFGDMIKSKAIRLGLRVGTFVIRPSTDDMLDDRAYPKDGAPSAWRNSSPAAPPEENPTS